MPLTAPPTLFSTISEALLAAAVSALDAPPARQLVAHGRPAWEVCTEDQLAVWIDHVEHRQSRGPKQIQVQPRADYVVEIVRCVPGLNGTRPPGADVLTASAVGLQNDFDQLERYVTANASAIFGNTPDVSYGNAVPLGPLGQVAGWSWPITVGRV